MYRKLLAAFAAVALLAACESSTESSDALKGAGNARSSGTTAAPGSAADFVVNVGDRVFFDFDKSDVKSDSQQVLDRQAAWLKQYASTKVVIEGHCDERGTREYNLALGERRATAAKNYLVSKGIDAKRLQTISYGKERPAVLGANEASWSQNRRAVTVVQEAGANVM
jgi:peptidoglycan-associated lipoprotein